MSFSLLQHMHIFIIINNRLSSSKFPFHHLIIIIIFSFYKISIRLCKWYDVVDSQQLSTGNMNSVVSSVVCLFHSQCGSRTGYCPDSDPSLQGFAFFCFRADALAARTYLNRECGLSLSLLPLPQVSQPGRDSKQLHRVPCSHKNPIRIRIFNKACALRVPICNKFRFLRCLKCRTRWPRGVAISVEEWDVSIRTFETDPTSLYTSSV